MTSIRLSMVGLPFRSVHHGSIISLPHGDTAAFDFGASAHESLAQKNRHPRPQAQSLVHGRRCPECPRFIADRTCMRNQLGNTCRRWRVFPGFKKSKGCANGTRIKTLYSFYDLTGEVVNGVRSIMVPSGTKKDGPGCPLLQLGAAAL
jgi:hypothetical protein